MFTGNDFQESASHGGLYVKPQFSPRNVIVRDEAGQILHAVVGVHGRMPHPKWTEIKYFSASCQEEAILKFKRFYWTITQTTGFVEIVAGPAIGFFVHDNHGDSLSAGGTRPEANPLDRGTEFEGKAA